MAFHNDNGCMTFGWTFVDSPQPSSICSLLGPIKCWIVTPSFSLRSNISKKTCCAALLAHTETSFPLLSKSVWDGLLIENPMLASKQKKGGHRLNDVHGMRAGPQICCDPSVKTWVGHVVPLFSLTLKLLFHYFPSLCEMVFSSKTLCWPANKRKVGIV